MTERGQREIRWKGRRGGTERCSERYEGEMKIRQR